MSMPLLRRDNTIEDANRHPSTHDIEPCRQAEDRLGNYSNFTSSVLSRQVTNQKAVGGYG
jgi:hypothetical protein